MNKSRLDLTGVGSFFLLCWSISNNPQLINFSLAKKKKKKKKVKEHLLGVIFISFCRQIMADQKDSSRTCGHLSSRPDLSVGFEKSHSILTVSKTFMCCTPRTGMILESTLFSQAAGQTLSLPLLLATKQQHQQHADTATQNDSLLKLKAKHLKSFFCSLMETNLTLAFGFLTYPTCCRRGFNTKN